MTKTKQMRTLYACLILILITGSIFIALAFGAGRRAKPSETETQSESVIDTEPQATEDDETKEPSDTEKTPESTKPTVESTPVEDVPVSVQIEDIRFVSPSEGNVIVTCSLTVPVYSMTMNDYRTHMGVDIAAESGSAVVSCADGRVTSVYEDPMMGTTVEITHGEGIVSVYKNLSAELPERIVTGTELSAGDTVGFIGNTALIECEEESHLHFELHLDGEAADPAEYIEMTMASEVFED